MRRAAVWVLGLPLSLLLAAKPARACIVDEPHASFHGMPSDGDDAVPTDVVFYYEIPAVAELVRDPPRAVPGSFTMTDDEGVEVELSVRRLYSFYFELTPAHELEPHTRYTLHGEWPEPHETISADDVRFETGAGPLEEKPKAPRAVMTHFVIDSDVFDSCGPPRSGSCVSVADDDAWLELTFIDEYNQKHDPDGAQGSFTPNLSGIDQGTNYKCVSLRTRALNGTYSGAVKLCGKDAPLVELAGFRGSPTLRCTSEGLSWGDSTGPRGHTTGPNSGSGDCSTSGPGARATGAWSAALWLLVALALCTRITRPYASSRTLRK